MRQLLRAPPTAERCRMNRDSNDNARVPQRVK